jgi:hypothetical protein
MKNTNATDAKSTALPAVGSTDLLADKKRTMERLRLEYEEADAEAEGARERARQLKKLYHYARDEWEAEAARLVG